MFQYLLSDRQCDNQHNTGKKIMFERNGVRLFRGEKSGEG